MVTEKQLTKENIEDGASIIEAFECVDLDQLRQEGEEALADRIETVLSMVTGILETLGVK